MATPSNPSKRSLKQSTLSFKRVHRAKPETKSQSSSSGQVASDATKSEKDSLGDTDQVPRDVLVARRHSSVELATKLSSTMTIKIIEETGDLFSEPSNSVLIHACNSVGSWGGGIALAFKKNYPNAFRVYSEHCTASSPDALIGTALLIPPCELSGPRHYVGCLFTSRAFGRRKDSAPKILQATKPAMEQLLEEISNEGRENIDNIVMCKINSGLFSVPWDQTRAIIECLDVDMKDIPKEIRVISPPS